ncbi:MAG: serine hydrolase [Mycobacteriales bacterium]
MTRECDEVAARIRELFAASGYGIGFHAVELGGDAEIAVDADEPAVVGSVFKIWVALEYFRQVADGTLDPATRVRLAPGGRTPGPVGISALKYDVEASLGDLAALMMWLSDNAATDAVLDAVGGPERVTATLAGLGRTRTRLTLNTMDMIDEIAVQQGFPDMATLIATDPADMDPAELAALPHRTPRLAAFDPARAAAVSTPRDTTALLDQIWRDAAGPARACHGVRELMRRQHSRARIASGFDHDRGAATVYAKSGGLSGVVRNEAGAVRLADGRTFLVAAYTTADPAEGGAGPADRMIGTAARLAVDALSGRT